MANIVEKTLYIGKCKYCDHETYFKKTPLEAELDILDHEDDCPMNVKNQMCATCKHWPFARTFEANDDDFDYGWQMTDNINVWRLCNYVETLVKKNVYGCKYWTEKEQHND